MTRERGARASAPAAWEGRLVAVSAQRSSDTSSQRKRRLDSAARAFRWSTTPSRTVSRVVAPP